MAAVAIIAKPAAEGTRQALVLTEDRLGHYPEFREQFHSDSASGNSQCEHKLQRFVVWQHHSKHVRKQDGDAHIVRQCSSDA